MENTYLPLLLQFYFLTLQRHQQRPHEFSGSSVKQKFYGVKQAKKTTWIGFGAFREISPVFGVYGNVDFRVEDKKWADSVISTGLQYRF